MDTLKKQHFFQGNLSEIRRIMDDIQQGKQRKIAILGASVSKGEIVPKGTDFFTVLKNRWNTYFQMQSAPEFINASKSGTLSGNGMFSMWELVEQKPDLVFLDYSVNDPGDAYLTETFEGMLCNFLRQGCFVVVLLFCNNHGQSTRGAMCRIARHYDVPFIDIGRIVMDSIENGAFSWEDFAVDYVHPSIWGHEFIADILLEFFGDAQKFSGTKPFQIPEAPCFDGVFRDLRIVEQMPWDNHCFTYEDSFSMLVIEYTQSQQPSKCAIDIFMDGEYVRTIEKYADFSWDNRVVNFLYADEKNSRHKVELRPAVNAVFSEEELSIFNIKLGIGTMPANE